jgi:hypothetical protein
LHEQEKDDRTRPIGQKALQEICKPRADMGKEEVMCVCERERESKWRKKSLEDSETLVFTI